MGPEEFAEAPFLPAPYEFELLRALAAQPDGGGPLFERMIADGTPTEVSIAEDKRSLTLLFDPSVSMLLVSDPSDPEDGRFRWRRLRRLVLRNLLLSNLARSRAALQDRYPLLAKALSYPRPTVDGSHEFAALTQLEARCDVQLERSETVTFDLPFGASGSKEEDTGLRAQLSHQLAQLSPDQVVAMVQDDLFDLKAAGAVPTVYPVEQWDELTALVRHANPVDRASVSLVLPVEARLLVDLGTQMKPMTLETTVALFYLDLNPAEVMDAVRSAVMSRPASEVLEHNGLSLRDLSIRESRFAAPAKSDE